MAQDPLGEITTSSIDLTSVSTVNHWNYCLAGLMARVVGNYERESKAFRSVDADFGRNDVMAEFKVGSTWFSYRAFDAGLMDFGGTMSRGMMVVIQNPNTRAIITQVAFAYSDLITAAWDGTFTGGQIS